MLVDADACKRRVQATLPRGTAEADNGRLISSSEYRSPELADRREPFAEPLRLSLMLVLMASAQCG